jgi:hypothetical protein
MDKQCFKCNATKPIDQFYKHAAAKDGYLNKCKDCTKADVTLNRKTHIERYREYDKKRSQHPERRKAHAQYVKDWQEANQQRTLAHSQVQNAIRNGSLVRMPCIKCGNEKSQGHHEDYNKPLDVVWLCSPCHQRFHHDIRKHHGTF